MLLLSRSSLVDEERLKEYITDDKALFKPDGLVIITFYNQKIIRDIDPKPIVSTNGIHSLIFLVDRREIEEKTENHRETVEELIELKKKLTSKCSLHSSCTVDLKRERRMERERLGLV